VESGVGPALQPLAGNKSFHLLPQGRNTLRARPKSYTSRSEYTTRPSELRHHLLSALPPGWCHHLLDPTRLWYYRLLANRGPCRGLTSTVYRRVD